MLFQIKKMLFSVDCTDLFTIHHLKKSKNAKNTKKYYIFCYFQK